MVVGFAAGGAADTAARLIAKKLGENIGQSVVIDNKAGAGGNIAHQFTANGPADGSVILFGSVGPLAIAPHLMKLPYDPVRDRVLLVEQFRAGPMARGDAQAWQLEPIAGRVDPSETPEMAARREAEEEAGLHLTRLEEVARYYPSPGAVSEFLYSYVAVTDLPDGVAGVFGLAEEAEDIRGHLITLDHLLALVATGEVQNAPLILTALWLQRERPRLRNL
jgi:nudix-type nucleoside diphosphatase (YffH/AdpP family)